MDGDDVFVEIKMFEIKSVVALFAGHEVGQDTGGAAIPFPEGVDEEEFAVDAGDVPGEGGLVRVSLGKGKQEFFLEGGHAFRDEACGGEYEATLGHVDRAKFVGKRV